MEGYVYVLSNECMPGIYKVGCTTKSAKERAEELSKTTNMPTDFKVELSFFVFNTLESEKLMHDALKQYRINPNKEFFKVDLYTIEQASSCLYGSYCNMAMKISEDINFTGGFHYKKNYKGFLEANIGTLKEHSFRFDYFNSIFKKEGIYYYAQCFSKVCTVKQYKEWVKEKLVDPKDDSDTEENKTENE